MMHYSHYIYRQALVWILATWVYGMCQSQDNAFDISCIDTTANYITFNNADWTPLFNQLTQLEDTTDTTVDIISIAHIGDSHIQAGFFTEGLRIPLQQKWGNAGRGLITPLRISNTNEPTYYKISTPDDWTHYRCVLGKKFDSNVGISGISILPTSGEIDLTFETYNHDDCYAGFNSLRLFHSESENFPQLIPDTVCEEIEIDNSRRGETRYSWKTTTNSIHLQGFNSYELECGAIYAASIENGNSGIIVHAIGNNSATYECYNRVNNYASKLSALTPHLIIISMGTNESVSSTITSELLYSQIDQLVSSIRQEIPQALILLTTPAENKIRRRRRKNNRRRTYYVDNKHITDVVETIKQYGIDHNIAVWDWYTISGGKGSCETWVKERGMTADRIHYTANGYTLQGNLLYNSIHNAYEKHIR